MRPGTAPSEPVEARSRAAEAAPGSLLDVLVPRLMDPAHLHLGTPGLYTFVNPHTYMLHRRDPRILAAFRGVFVDGILLVHLLRWTGVASLERASFDMGSLAPRAFSWAEAEGRSVYLIGTRPDLIGKAVKNLTARYPGLELRGHRHGYFQTSDERKETARRIAGLAPDVVVAGMGAPLQERFLVELRHAGWTGLGFTCGGFLHQTARSLRYYHPVVNRYHLRWLVRMVREPHVFGRVVRHYPAMVATFMRERLGWHRP